MGLQLTAEESAKYRALKTDSERKVFVDRIKKIRAAGSPPAVAAGKPKAVPSSKKSESGSEAEKIRALFAGRKLNVKALDEDAKAREDGGVSWKKLEAGEHLVRFLPPVQDTGRLATLVVQCWFDDPDSDEEKRKPYYSPRCADPTAYCPVTAAYRAAMNHANEDFRKLAEKIKPEKFYIANVLLYDAVSREWKPEVLYMSSALYRDVAKKQVALVDPEDWGEDGSIATLGIADPLKNRVVVIKREGAGMKTKWEVGLRDKTYACTLAQLEARVDLDAIATPADEALLESLVCDLFGIGSVGELINAKVAKGTSAQNPGAASKAGASKKAQRPRVESVPESEDVIIEDDSELTDADLLSGDNSDLPEEETIDGESDSLVIEGDDDPLNFDE